MVFQGSVFHSYTGIAVVLMTFVLLTCGFTFQSIVSPSAYPGHYPRRWLLRQSHHFSSMRFTPTLNIDHFRALEEVTPFLMSVFRNAPPALSTRFCFSDP